MIALDQQDGVFILRLQDGENRFNLDSLRAWNEALDRVEAAPDPIALVTVGEGKFYSNGLDLAFMASAGAQKATQVVGGVHALLGRMLTFPCITIAAMNGHAFAAGAMVSLAHDYRVMRSDRGYFCLPEIDIKLPFTPPMQSLIQARLSKITAHEAMVTGRRYTADESLRASIVHQSVPEAEVLPAALAIGKSLAGKDRSTLVAIKRSMYGEVLAAIEAAKAAAPTPNV